MTLPIRKHRPGGSVWPLCILVLLLSAVLPLSIACTDHRNDPNSQITELTWSEGPYKIFYYVSEEGLFAQYSDGTGKQLIYPSDRPTAAYLLLNSRRQILLRTGSEVVLLQEDGTNLQTVFMVPEEKWIRSWYISPDEEKMGLVLADDNYKLRHAVYLVDLSTGDSKHLTTLAQEWGYDKIDHIRWSRDSRAILILAPSILVNGWQRKFANNDCGYARYDLSTARISICDPGAYDFLSTITRNGNVDPVSYARRSPDGQKFATGEGGVVYVDGVEIMRWYGYDPKFYIGCGRPSWLPDSHHLVVTGCDGLRIIETSTGMIAKLDDGTQPQVFGVLNKGRSVYALNEDS